MMNSIPMNEVTTMESMRTLWSEMSRSIDSEYHQAAVKLADQVAISKLEGVPDTLYLVEFQCAVHKRNTLLNAVASMLLRSVELVIDESEVYAQYTHGLISGVECCKALAGR